jgi:hypothetical protein
MSDLTELEKAVIEKLLKQKNGKDFHTLQEQLGIIEASSRELTGHGFFTTFSLPATAERVPGFPSFKLDNVTAKIPSLQHGAGFLLYIEQGALHMLEGYCFGETWTGNITDFALEYVNFK